MDVYSVDELIDALTDPIERFGAEMPVRWSDAPRGGAAAARPLAVTVRALHAHPTVILSPALVGADAQPPVETVAELLDQLRDPWDSYGVDLRIFWMEDPRGGPAAAVYLSVEVETFDGVRTVVMFPA